MVERAKGRGHRGSRSGVRCLSVNTDRLTGVEWLLANAVALVALCISGFALWQSLRREKRATEFSEVSWSHDWVVQPDGAARLDLTHTGSTRVKRVRVMVSIDNRGTARGKFRVAKPGDVLSIRALEPRDVPKPAEGRRSVSVITPDTHISYIVKIHWLTPWGNTDNDSIVSAGLQLF